MSDKINGHITHTMTVFCYVVNGAQFSLDESTLLRNEWNKSSELGGAMKIFIISES